MSKHHNTVFIMSQNWCTVLENDPLPCCWWGQAVYMYMHRPTCLGVRYRLMSLLWVSLLIDVAMHYQCVGGKGCIPVSWVSLFIDV